MADLEAEMLCSISRELILIQHQCHVNNCHTVLSREEHWGKVCAFGTEGDIFSIFDWWLLTPRIQSLHTLRTDVPMHASVVVTLTFVPVVNLFLLYCILMFVFLSVCAAHTLLHERGGQRTTWESVNSLFHPMGPWDQIVWSECLYPPSHLVGSSLWLILAGRSGNGDYHYPSSPLCGRCGCLDRGPILPQLFQHTVWASSWYKLVIHFISEHEDIYF